MPATWTHPELGKFKYDIDAWTRAVDAPAFDAFSYDTGSSNAAPTGKYELSFYTEEETDHPSPDAAALAVKVLANQSNLVKRVVAALWDDFNGVGPDSGMWWHDGLDEVSESFEAADLPPPTRAQDLLPAMRLFQIAVRQRDDDERPVVELCFWAAFEEEHNVGVLTDGQKVLGIGYHVDVTPFDEESSDE